MSNQTARRYPVISLGAEYLAMGHLLRRNILTYQAPPNHAGYDLLCLHPDPTRPTPPIRVQVKSRYQTDCDRAFPVKEKSFESFDYLIIVFLNNGSYFDPKQAVREGQRDPEFYTLPVDVIRRHHQKTASGWDRVLTKGLDLTPYHNALGFEQIAQDLGIAYPGMEARSTA